MLNPELFDKMKLVVGTVPSARRLRALNDFLNSSAVQHAFPQIDYVGNDLSYDLRSMANAMDELERYKNDQTN